MGSHGLGRRAFVEALVASPFGGIVLSAQTQTPSVVKPSHADLLVLKELCEAGTVRPVIDRRFPLSEVSSAVRYVEDGHACGKVVVMV